MRYLDGVHAQADNLATSRATVTDALDSLSRLEPLLAGRGPVVLTGMGASVHAALPTVEALRSAGRPAHAVTATSLLRYAPAVLGDLLVAVSSSGRSAETAAVLDRTDGPASLAVCNDVDSPVGRGATHSLPLGSMPDTAVYTLTYTASLQALGLLAEVLGAPPRVDWAALPGHSRTVLDTCAASIDRVCSRWKAKPTIDVVATGTSAASGGETALLLREAAHIPASFFDTFEYLHGPLEVAEPGHACIVFGDGREVTLARDLADYGSEVLLITTASVQPTDRLTILEVPDVPPLARPVLEIMPAQLLAWRLAQGRGLRISGFRHHQADTKLEAR